MMIFLGSQIAWSIIMVLFEFANKFIKIYQSYFLILKLMLFTANSAYTSLSKNRNAAELLKFLLFVLENMKLQKSFKMHSAFQNFNIL